MVRRFPFSLVYGSYEGRLVIVASRMGADAPVIGETASYRTPSDAVNHVPAKAD
jgi:hypothetical protein